MCLHPKMIEPSNGNPMIVSCRKCSECMQVRANEWGVRCHHEITQSDKNCFITLTYEKTPVRLHKEHLQNFIKRLRKKISPIKIKYFSCGEYGDQNLRPHYHLIIFNYDFDDKEFWKLSKSKKAIFISKELKELWQYGLSTVQEANKQTAMYAAKYQAKQKNELPELLQKYPEFNTMSKNLGIKPILEKIDLYLKTKEIYIDGFAYAIPSIVLKKYCDLNGLDYKEFMNDYWKNKLPKTALELETKRRLSKKRKLFSSLREL